MITYLQTSAKDLLAIQIDGKVDLTQENEAIAHVEEMLKETNTIRALAIIPKGSSATIPAIAKDLSFVLRNLKHFSKIAIVADSKTLRALVDIDSVFAKAFAIEEKAFATNQIDDAWHWLES